MAKECPGKRTQSPPWPGTTTAKIAVTTAGAVAMPGEAITSATTKEGDWKEVRRSRKMDNMLSSSKQKQQPAEQQPSPQIKKEVASKGGAAKRTAATPTEREAVRRHANEGGQNASTLGVIFEKI